MRKPTLNEADKPAIIEEYVNGMTMSSVARKYHTYPTTIRRLLKQHNIEVRDNVIRKGDVLLTDGDKLLEWAKAQGRLVTKAELGQIVRPYEQKELAPYIHQLYDWLKSNRVSYKPNDKHTLEGVAVHATLLGKYKNILVHIAIKPITVSRKNFITSMESKRKRAKEKDVEIIFLTARDFPDLKVLRRKLGK